MSKETPSSRGPGAGEVAAVAAAFVLSRLLYAAAGVRFQAQTLDFYWQFLDPELLRGDLARSLLHLHSQPPLFNLFLGAALRLPAAWQGPAFHAVYLALGLGLGLALLALLARLGAGRGPRLALTLFFLLSPACVLYEHQLFYTYPVTAALAAAALLLHRFVAGGRTRDGVLFFSLLAAVCLTQSLFHLAWPLAVAAAVAWLQPARRRQIALAAAGPLLVVALWYARGALLFGSFSASTWMGMSLAQSATRLTPDEERVRLARAEPDLAILAVKPYSPLAEYTDRVPLPAPTGVPALDRAVKSTGAPNYNHLAYVGISRAYLGAARAWIARFPGRYLQAVKAAHMVYFRSAADNNWLGANRWRIARFARAWDLVAQGQWRAFGNRLGPGAVAWWWVLLLPVVVVAAALRIARAARVDAGDADAGDADAGDAGKADAATLTALYLLLTILWVAVVGNWLELGENNRFRFLTEPLALALAGWLANRPRSPSPGC